MERNYKILVQRLPFERKWWEIYLLSLITFGIYGVFIQFTMRRETNIACVEDGKHTRGFWGVVGLCFVTGGFYGIIWYVKWLNREAAYLQRHNKGNQFSGLIYLVLFILCLFVCFATLLLLKMPFVTWLPSAAFAIFSLYKTVVQHNTVCAAYNEINNPVAEAE